MNEKERDLILPIIAAGGAGIAIFPVAPLLGSALLFAVGTWGIKYYREHGKLAGVFRNCGIVNKDGQIAQLREKKRIDGGIMYRYSLPPGFCVNDVIRRQDAIEGFLGKTVSIKSQIKDAVIEVYDSDIEKYDFELTPWLEIGRGRGGKPVKLDFATFPHLLIAGESGSGKSTLLRALICNMLLGKTKCKLSLVDLKGGTECGIFRKHPRVAHFARTQREAEAVINAFAAEIDRRYEEFFQSGVISGNVEPWYLIIDEFAELEETDVMTTVKSIAARGRAAGCNMIISTQRPDAKILEGGIKANLTSVVGFKTANRVNSEIVLGVSGLERMKGQGNGVFKCAGEFTEFQAPYLSEKRARELIG